MASVEKFTEYAVVNQLRHNMRTIEHNSNIDIDKEKLDLNYDLTPDRNMTAYDYFKQRKEELYVYGRDDVKVMAGWIVTAPKDLAPNMYNIFFDKTNKFLTERYGEKNLVQSVVHKDEAGQPHLHFLFIPAVKDLKHGGEKICANDVLNRRELRNFHPEFQAYLNKEGMDTKVMTGITRTQGGNRTVKNMKQEKVYQQEVKRRLRF